MPRRAPAEPIDHHYNIPKLNRVFAATGIVLTIVFIGMVVEDYSRGWKRIQRAFTRIDARKAREAALAARRTALGEERAKLRHELTLANKELAAHRRELARLDRKLKDLAPQIYLADQQFKFTKASLDAQRYRYENALATAGGLAVLIVMLGPISGGHFNPAVSAADWFLGRNQPAG